MEKENLKLKCETRTITGRKVNALRKEDKLPGVVYGKDVDSTSVTLNTKKFKSIYDEAGTSTLVSLKIDGENKDRKVLIHEPQTDPVSGNPIHVDFYEVNMKEKIRTEIPLEFIGDSPAVIDLEGNLITNKDAVEVECLPDDLVSEIQIDISILKTFDDSIYVSNINIPEGIEILDDPEELIASVTEPRSEEELEATLAEPIDETEASKIEELGGESTEETESETESPTNKTEEK